MLSHDISPASKLSQDMEDKIAIDITTGYGADSFLSTKLYKDPWCQDCFIKIIDAAVNHREFYYPLPTPYSAEEELVDHLPHSMKAFHKAGIIGHIDKKTAEEIGVSIKTLEDEYVSFCQWAKNNARMLKKWIDLHSWKVIREQADKRIGQDVQPFIEEFCARNKDKIADLAKEIGVKPEEIRFTFDTIFRGLQYYDILTDYKIFYFSHPIRGHLFSTQKHSQIKKFSDRLSWGRLISNLIESDRIRRETEEVGQLVKSIRDKVLENNATWYDVVLIVPEDKNDDDKKMIIDKNGEEKITAIAADSGLPAKIRDELITKIKNSIRATRVIATATALLTTSLPLFLVSVALGEIEVSVNKWSGNMPSWGNKVKFLRGSLQWPGLFSGK